MKTFFYSINEAQCGAACSYRTCPRRYFSKLQIGACRGEISALNGAVGVLPKHGDIIILYAQDRKDLERMILIKESFEGLRKILVVGETHGIDGSICHQLSPRFITRAERSLEELESVIEKMKQQVN